MIEKDIFSYEENNMSLNDKKGENIQYIEVLKDNDNINQLEFFSNNNSQLITSDYTFHDNLEINRMNYFRNEQSLASMGSIGIINEKINWTHSPKLDFSKVMENLNIFNTPNITEKTKIKTNDFLGKKRKFNSFSNEFMIFNKGGKDIRTRQIIEEVRNSSKSKGKIKTRKDNERKKIKRSFMKSLIDNANKHLRRGGSKKLFNYLPYKFTSSVTKNCNREIMDLTFKELLSKNFYNEDDENSNNSNLKKYKENLSVLDYLEKSDEICQNSNYYKFKNMKLYQILDEYLRSNEFEQKIANLIKKEDSIYMYTYIHIAYNLIDYYY